MKYKILGLLLLFFCAFQNEAKYEVVRILDGDTIEILSTDRGTTRIRLAAIDCPEKGQAFGQVAKQQCSDLCFRKIVTIKVIDTDKYGRSIAHIYLPDGTELNRELVKLGCAWHYKKYSKDQSLDLLESKARESKLGLWNDPNPVAPWEYRKLEKENN